MSDVQDVGDERQVKKRKTKAQLSLEQTQEDIKRVVATDAGAYLIWRILSQCGLYTQAPFGMEDAYRAEGRRDVGLWLLTEIMTTDQKLFNRIQSVGIKRDGE